MTGLPTGIAVEMETSPGTWLDVTSRAYASQAATTRYGRDSPFSSPSAATMTLTLKNDTGEWITDRAVLVDGSTANSRYPWFRPGIGIRMSYTVSAVKKYRFTGKVQSIAPQTASDGSNPVVVLSCVDTLQHLAKVVLTSPLRTAYLADSALHFWPLTEPADSTSALDTASGGILQPSPGAALAFGDNGPGGGEGTGVKFSPSAAGNGQVLYGGNVPAQPGGDLVWSLEVWVNTNAALPAWGTGAGAVQNILGMDSIVEQFRIYLVNGVLTVGTVSASLAGNSFASSTAWHQVVLVCTSTALNVTDLYIDGVYVNTISASMVVAPGTTIAVGDNPNPGVAFPAARFQGNVGFVGYWGQVTLTAAQVAAHYAAGHSGWSGDRTDQRIARWLTWAGYTSSDWNLDTGSATVGTYPQNGQDVFSACQDMAVTEGGGSVFYQTPDGIFRFVDRDYRATHNTPALTVDGGGDLDAGTFGPSTDVLTLVNKSIVSRSTLSGTATTQTAQDDDSIALYDEFDESITSYATTDADALYLAQSRVAAQGQPGYKLPQLAVDLLTATTAGLYGAIAAVGIGDRIRVTGLDPATAPRTQMDVVIEGWTETFATDQYSLVYDCSPADNPAVLVLDDVVYGRLGAEGMTIGAITASATSMTVTTGAGLPTLSTAAGDYPMPAEIDSEIVVIASAPGSGSSPQTVTISRGQFGTSPAAHIAGTEFDVWPVATVGL